MKLLGFLPSSSSLSSHLLIVSFTGQLRLADEAELIDLIAASKVVAFLSPCQCLLTRHFLCTQKDPHKNTVWAMAVHRFTELCMTVHYKLI